MPCKAHPPGLHDVGAVRDGECEVDVLLDQEDGHALAPDLGDGLEDLAGDQRGEAERRLVQQEKPRAGHERAADGEHLLLAARERAGGLTAPLPEDREEGEDALEVRLHGGPVAARVGADRQVLLDGEAREHLAALGREAHAARDELPRPPAVDSGPREADLAGVRAHQARDGVERGRLPRAVRAHERHDLVRAHLERHVVNRADCSVPDGERADLEVRWRGRAGGPVARRCAHPCARRCAIAAAAARPSTVLTA